MRQGGIACQSVRRQAAIDTLMLQTSINVTIDVGWDVD